MTIQIKICGVTDPDDAVAAIDAGADMIGLNFSDQSVRRVTVDQARSIIDAIPQFHNFTGVFVEQTWDEVDAIRRYLGLAHCQTYSTPWLRERLTPAAHIAALRVRGAEEIQGIQNVLRSLRERIARDGSLADGSTDTIRSRSERSTLHIPDFILIDSFVPGAMGGTGHKAPWELLTGQDFGVPLILAGGLSPENVAEAIRIVRPWGVDVASGVESSPGRKDAGKMRAFVRAVRAL